MDSDPISRDLAKFLEQALNVQLSEPKQRLSEETLSEIAKRAGLSDVDWQRVCEKLNQHLQKGRNFLKFENYADAIVELDQAASLAPYCADVLSDCGRAHLGNWKKTRSKKSRDKAHEMLHKSLEIEPGHVGAAESLSDLKNSGDTRSSLVSNTLWMPVTGVALAVAGGIFAWMAFSKPTPEVIDVGVQELSEIPRVEEIPNMVEAPKVEELSRQEKVEKFIRDYGVLQKNGAVDFVNSLEMPFVDVPIFRGEEQISSLLFAVYETRIKDYRPFVEDTNHGDAVGSVASIQKPEAWSAPEFNYSESHPVTFVNWYDAKSFCEWLTLRERSAGTIGPNDRYRLPTDHEWSCAVGIGQVENAKASPKSKHNGLRAVFPWGGDWPPSTVLGNYQGPETDSNQTAPFLPDAYKKAAPAGSFPLTHWGIYDLGGNVYEWCEDQYEIDMHDEKTTRGGAFNVHDASHLFSGGRRWIGSYERHDFVGFRCVLERGEK